MICLMCILAGAGSSLSQRHRRRSPWPRRLRLHVADSRTRRARRLSARAPASHRRTRAHRRRRCAPRASHRSGNQVVAAVLRDPNLTAPPDLSRLVARALQAFRHQRVWYDVVFFVIVVVVTALCRCAQRQRLVPLQPFVGTTMVEFRQTPILTCTRRRRRRRRDGRLCRRRGDALLGRVRERSSVGCVAR